MCGIAAISSIRPESIDWIINQIKEMEKTRGGDGWGFAYKRGSKVWSHKGVFKFDLPPYYWRDIKSTIIIGHTRQASRGRVKVENTHPFLNENHDMALAHNGTAYAHVEVRKRHRIKGETDPEVILHFLEEQLSKSSVEDAFRNLEKEFYGALNIALIYENKLIVYSDGAMTYERGDGYLRFASVGLKNRLPEGHLAICEKDKMKTVEIKKRRRWVFQRLTQYIRRITVYRKIVTKDH